MVRNIDSSLMIGNRLNAGRKTGNDVLGKDDFLRILMTQLQNQDPLNPMQDKDFIAQMATFSSLEQMTNMSKSLENFVNMEQQNNLVNYNSFVGKEVAWTKMIQNEDSSIPPVVQEGNGRVSSIQFKNNQVSFVLEDGTIIEPANISQVNASSADNHVLSASMLIGKNVSYLNDRSEEVSAIVKSVSFKNGKTVYQLNDEAGTKITSAQITKIE